MDIICTDKKIETFIQANRRPDGQIAEGVYYVMQYNCDTGWLTRLWIGTKETGPLLEYYQPNQQAYADGYADQSEPDRQKKKCYDPAGGSWTPIYSRGNYGKNYACGGNWSGHCRNLIKSRLIGEPGPGDVNFNVALLDNPNGGKFVRMPEGKKGDVKTTSIDCSGSWTVWFGAAGEALSDMLTLSELRSASLPNQTKKHLISGQYSAAKNRIKEVTEAFGL